MGAVAVADLFGSPEETMVLRRAQHGDDSARDRLARACGPVAYRFALQLTRDADSALDLTQEALLRLFRRLDRLDPARPVRPWLLRIVRNLAVDRARRRAVRPEGFLADPPLVEMADEHQDPEARASRRELQSLVWHELAALTAEQREILALRDYLDLSYDEIAQVLAIPRGTVMSRLHRARRRLETAVRQRLREAHHG